MKRVISSILIAATVLTILLTLSSCSLGYRYDNASKYTAGGASISALVTELDINWISGNVKIEAYDGEEIIFSEESDRELDTKKQLHYYLDGTTLYIKYAKSGIISSNFPTKALTVMLPSTLICDLEIETVSSDVYVDYHSFDEISIESVSGIVDLNINNAGSLSLETVSGNIDLSVFNYISPCEIESVSGNITVFLPTDTDFSLEYDTVSGKLQNSFASQYSNGKIIYTAGTSEYSSSFEIETVSGNVEIAPLP